MKRLIPIICSALFFCACAPENTNPFVTANTEAAYDMRFSHASGSVPDNLVTQSMRIELANHFPIWRDELAVDLHIIIRNLADNFLATQSHARLFIYSPDDKSPLYWSNIDIPQAKSVGPGTLSIISLPIGATKDFHIPIQATLWSDIQIKSWPDTRIYDLVPTGKFLIRAEVEILDEKDNTLGTVVSNFAEFTLIHSDPAVVRTTDTN